MHECIFWKGMKSMERARHWLEGTGGAVDCLLCPHHCHIKPGRLGICRVRKNEGGALYSSNYGHLTSLAIDPTEKKPLYHFYPGSLLLSAGTVGCNLRCGFCQNWTISQTSSVPGEEMTPAGLVRVYERERERDKRLIGMAYTYNEPFMWYEYVQDTARLAHDRGAANVLVTNGFVELEPLEEILPLIDAMNIDVKSYRDEYYRKVCKGRLDPVIRTVETSKKAGCHIEVTTLLVPGLNDSAEEIEELSRWLASVGRDIPLHFSRYFPNYEFDLPPTPERTLVKAREVARRRLDYVYLGNIWTEDGSDTICPSCGRKVIERSAMELEKSHLDGKRCGYCGREIEIRGEVMGLRGE
jgi:pyruvate formate lyase activating enzyme